MNAGLPPLGGMSTFVVLAGSLAALPFFKNAIRSASDRPFANVLPAKSLPRPVNPFASGPWQAEQVPSNLALPLAASAGKPLDAGVAGGLPPQAARISAANETNASRESCFMEDLLNE